MIKNIQGVEVRPDGSAEPFQMGTGDMEYALRQVAPFHNPPSQFEGESGFGTFEECDVWWRSAAFEFHKKGNDFMADDMRQELEQLGEEEG